MKTVIIVNLSTEYEDIAKIFCELLSKNWPMNPYDVYFFTDGEMDFELPGKVILSKKGDSLPKNIRKAFIETKADYAICLLGDAFISSPISNEHVETLLNQIAAHKINYCRLIPDKIEKKNKKYYEYIGKNVSYPFSFIAFIASRKFVDMNFVGNITDLQLEKKYVIEAEKSRRGEKYHDHVIVVNDCFHIAHGIIKGKWVRSVKKKLDCISENSRHSDRQQLGYFSELRVKLQDRYGSRLGAKNKRRLKNILSFFGFKFSV